MYIVRSCDEPYLVVIVEAHNKHVFWGAIQGLAVLEEDAVGGAFGTDVGHYCIVVPLRRCEIHVVRLKHLPPHNPYHLHE